MTRAGALGILAAGALLALLPLAKWPLPDGWPAFLFLGIGVLLLERSGVTLDSEFRFSPAVPFYLTCGMLDTVGCAPAAALLLLETVARRRGATLPALESRSPLVGALAAMTAGRLFSHENWWLPAILGPACYLLGTLALEYQTRKRLSRADRLRWIRARLQIRPLQFTLAASSLATLALAQREPWLPLLMVPVLIATALAAENIVLKAQEASADKVLSEIDDLRGQRKKTARQLATVQTEKQVMEGFSTHLASRPNLQETASGLVATINKMVSADDLVVFLGAPDGSQRPTPFYYQAEEPHRSRLQGLALTGLRESIVETCWESKKPRTQKRANSTVDQLFLKNRSAVALPIGHIGVLYLGRQEETSFTATERKFLDWIANKAKLGFEAAFRNQREQQESAQQQEQMQELTKRVELLASLINCAEEMAATLQLEELADRLRELLVNSIPHQEGCLLFSWEQERQVRRAWPQRPSDLSLFESVQKSGLALLLKDTRKSQQTPPMPTMVSLICAPLIIRDKACGALCLGSKAAGHFTQEHLNQLRLISHQAGMAFSNARLFQQVVQAREQLEESQKSLLQSSKMSAIGELAAGVAHELNTPLGVMSLSLESALGNLEERPDSAKRMLNKALKAIERSQSITERLLTYSRKPSEQMELIELPHLINDTLEFLAFELSNFEPQLQLEQCRVKGRFSELQQVLINLVKNALQAMEQTPPEERILRISARRDAEHVVIEVEDCGIGMSEQQQDRVFEPFYTTKDVGKGTGLGLWVSLQIVEQHEGRIEMSSSLGQGSRFRILLPLG